MKKWYEKLFENYADHYDKEPFVTGTMGECDFIEKEIGFRKDLKILDVGCGTGRHSIELTKRGYNVTGTDLSESQLKRAREKAREQGVSLTFQRSDARNMPFSAEFDLVIMLCEGGFPLMETDEMNFQILKSAHDALKENGKIIFTTLNGLYPLFHRVDEFLATNAVEGNATSGKSSFDLMTFRIKDVTSFTDDSGKSFKIDSDERYYVPSEITWLLKSLGFRKIDIYGAKLSAFSRNDKLTTEDFEMLVVADKSLH
jgi:2-polyprenyl-3-methyl-5-hydroxy-6-metoxy-1,4-benzoquinol methylase